MQSNPPEIVLDSVNTWDKLNGDNAYIKGLSDGGKWRNLEKKEIAIDLSNNTTTISRHNIIKTREIRKNERHCLEENLPIKRFIL
ncbi:hypothetical protein [Prochlorococcus marinus]|uniref:hypothetical protein n=1 Tax=Prochlorococcus marinus TaxID=1219 RepID=UPI0007BC7232|nr:hypothetical protein [Prochlorococcus marinus]KZR83577.1 hypothetical protein PMIT1327_00347 [Prochlorococcus marinus str. MIT 1327]